MSDHIPTSSSGEDRMRDTLTALRVDADRVGLPDAGSVRRRGQTRSRHQVVAGLAAVVAVVAVVIGGGSLLGGATRHDPNTVATNPPPTAKAFELASDPLLRPDDIGTAAGFPVWLANPDPASANVQVHQCVPVPSTLGAQQSESRMFYDDTDPSHVYEHVLRFADVASATQAGQSLLSSLSSCTRGGTDVVARGPEEVSVAGADTAARASRSASPPGSEVSYYELAVVRKGNVLIVLQCNSMVVADGTDWVWFSQRLKIALQTAVAG